MRLPHPHAASAGASERTRVGITCFSVMPCWTRYRVLPSHLEVPMKGLLMDSMKAIQSHSYLHTDSVSVAWSTLQASINRHSTEV